MLTIKKFSYYGSLSQPWDKIIFWGEKVRIAIVKHKFWLYFFFLASLHFAIHLKSPRIKSHIILRGFFLSDFWVCISQTFFFFFFAILKKDRFVRSKVVKFYLSVCLQVNKDSTQTFPYCPFKLAIKQTYRRWNIINILIDFNLICIIIFFTIKSPKKLISKIYKKYKCWISVYQPQS